MLGGSELVGQHVGDFNGDGKSDLVWRNNDTGETALWLMNGPRSAPDRRAPRTWPHWRVTTSATSTATARTDIVWRNVDAGATALWLMNGLTYSTFATVLGDPTWQVQNPRGGH